MVDGKAKVSLALVCSGGQGEWSCWSQSDTHTQTHTHIHNLQRGPSANDSGLVFSREGRKEWRENEGDWWDRLHFSHHWSAIYSSLLLKLTSPTFAGFRSGESNNVLGLFVCSFQSCLPQNLRNTLRTCFFSMLLERFISSTNSDKNLKEMSSWTLKVNSNIVYADIHLHITIIFCDILFNGTVSEQPGWRCEQGFHILIFRTIWVQHYWVISSQQLISLADFRNQMIIVALLIPFSHGKYYMFLQWHG